MSTVENNEGNTKEYDAERAAHQAVDLLLPEKGTMCDPRQLMWITLFQCALFGALAFAWGVRDGWLLFWVAAGAASTLGPFLNAAYRPFHNIDCAWRYLCLRCSTQIGWLIFILLFYLIWA
ncbi:hypothetical protein [Pseudomonas fluorescens]|uniref:Transmembrane protein n=1 Tax=Pseudomonas fluorescens TaxID=294 RepID=A0A5E7BHF6_PSEFL|nr:hypothetical protein [Pseudomonas fluorescens]VVN91366.1 hypothetical protein PS723_01895 [Pseudomonas fluorescens]